MTGGRIKRAMKYISDDTFMVTYGDGVADIDINKLLQFHMSHGHIATVTIVKPVSRFGVLQIGEGNRINKFDEKPTLEGSISAGFYVFNRKLFDYLGDDECVLERNPLMNLAKDGELYAYHHPGTFNVMDTYRDYLELNTLWNNNEAKWKVW
jgi:glucose-1-phosphate cytidylyltransferase